MGKLRLVVKIDRKKAKKQVKGDLENKKSIQRMIKTEKYIQENPWKNLAKILKFHIIIKRENETQHLTHS